MKNETPSDQRDFLFPSCKRATNPAGKPITVGNLEVCCVAGDNGIWQGMLCRHAAATLLGCMLLACNPAAGPGPDPCTDGESICDADGVTSRRCQAGTYVATDCLASEGRLCEAGRCVDPWRYGAPVFSTCPDEPRATPQSLATKAAAYDGIAERLHTHPLMKWVLDVELTPATDETQATYRDVAIWRSGENDGLWSALYLASQAYRYAVSHEAQALANVRRLLQGEAERMRITGVPGLFTRQLIPPGVTGLSCPTDDNLYKPSADKTQNRWVKVQSDGCIWIVDATTGKWTATDRCGLKEFGGWCWLDNVSQDEYAGHMYALGAVARLVDVPDVQTDARKLVEQIGMHLVNNQLTFVDWDGRRTRYGKLYPGAPSDDPGYLAVMALDFVRIAAELGGRTELRALYDDCLLQKSGAKACLPWFASPRAFTDYLAKIQIFDGTDGCESNFNDISMLVANFHHLIWFEREPTLRALYQRTFDEQVMRAPNPKAAVVQRNAWFNFMWTAQKQSAAGPGATSDGPAYQAVQEGVCMLKQFPASQHTPSRDPATLQPHYCDSRQGFSMAQAPFPVADRCTATFLWWGDPYLRRGCTDRPTEVQQPAGYLLAYWLGRYYGFIPEGL